MQWFIIFWCIVIINSVHVLLSDVKKASVAVLVGVVYYAALNIKDKEVKGMLALMYTKANSCILIFLTTSCNTDKAVLSPNVCWNLSFTDRGT